MPLKDSLRFLVSFALNIVPIQLNILKLLFFSLLHNLLGTDPAAKSTYPSLASLLVKRKKPCPYARTWNAHPYVAPTTEDSRSPCPALNTMANHGYIPHDGRNLTGTMLTRALMECYALSWPLAAFLAWGGVLLLGQVGTLELHDLARHDRVEHDASLTHANAGARAEYAPVHSDGALFARFLADARGGQFTAADIARARVRRERERGMRVSGVQQEVARGEVALVLQIFGGEAYAVPVEVVRTWWGEERLPDGWAPTRETTLAGTMRWSSVIRNAMTKLRAGGRKQEVGEIKEEVKVQVKVKENGFFLEQMERTKTYTPPQGDATLESFEDEGIVYAPIPARKLSVPVAVSAAA